MEKNPAVVVDTNVIISGLLSPNGIPGAILAQFRQKKFSLVTSNDQLSEIKEVLKRPSLSRALPAGTTREILIFFSKLKKLVVISNPPSLEWNFRDKGDHFLLDLIAHTKPDFFVTGDKELLSLTLLGNTPVLSPSQFIGRLQK